MLSGSIPRTRPAVRRNSVPTGSGYFRKRSPPASASRRAASTRGDGGYGFSLVLSLMMSSALGCSPGVYPDMARMLERRFSIMRLSHEPEKLRSTGISPITPQRAKRVLIHKKNALSLGDFGTGCQFSELALWGVARKMLDIHAVLALCQ